MSLQTIQIMQTVTNAMMAAVDIGLVAFALIHARSGRFPRLVRWAGMAIIVLSIPVSVISFGEGIWEFRSLPFTRPGNIFGTYWEPTGVMILGVIMDSMLWLLAAILAFVRRGWATAIYLLLATEGAVYGAQALLTHTAPISSMVGGLLTATLPAIALAAILLSIRGAPGLWHPRAALRHPTA